MIKSKISSCRYKFDVYVSLNTIFLLPGKCDINRGYSLPLDVTVSEESSSAPGCAGQSGISICKQVNHQNFHSSRNYKINNFFHKKA